MNIIWKQKPVWALIGVVIVALILAVLARWESPVSVGSDTPTQATTPSFGSVTMKGKGTFGGLGPDWIVLRETYPDEAILPGVTTTHALLLKHAGDDIVMRASEVYLADAQALDRIRKASVRSTELASSTLYVIPTGDMGGATAALRCGDTSCVMAELAHGMDRPFESLSFPLPVPVVQFLVTAEFP